MSVNIRTLKDILMLMHTSAEKEVRAQASISPQMKQWLSECDKEAPWTPLSLSNSSAGHVPAGTAIESDLEDLLDHITAQTHTNGNTNV